MTLAAEFAKLERDAREMKESLHPTDISDLLTAIGYYIRGGFRRGKADTTLRNEYYDLMYFYEDIVLHNGFVSESDIRPVLLSTSSDDDVLMHLHRLRTKQPEKHHKRKTISDATVERRFRILHAFFALLLKSNVIGQNPCFGLQKPPVRKKIPAAWDLQSVQVFLASFDKSKIVEHKNWLISLCLLDSGMRAGELCSLKVSLNGSSYRNAGFKSPKVNLLVVVAHSDSESLILSKNEQGSWWNLR